MKGYLNFDMIGCNNNEKAYSYGLSLHESVPAFGDWQKNDIRDVSIISSTYQKKFGNYIQSYSITFVNKRKIILSYVSEI